MTDTRLLIGSLSNDLFRVASLTQRGSNQAATRFLQEAKRWSTTLKKHKLPSYIMKITEEISSYKKNIDIVSAEKFLMYGILLQNYALHHP